MFKINFSNKKMLIITIIVITCLVSITVYSVMAKKPQHTEKPFPSPDYDSGWISYTGCNHFTLNHNIGGNPDNYVVDIQFQKVTYGVTNWDIGDEFYYWNLSSNSISLWVCWNDITSYRCRIWEYS